MVANSNQKLKLLYLLQILLEETDDKHGLTMVELIERLEELGITSERKGIYRDMDLLRESGFEITMQRGKPTTYAIAQRDFSLEELMLLVDAIQSSRFITQRQCNILINNIKLLASAHQRDQLDKRIHVAGRIRTKNDSVFTNIDIIHEAMRLKKKIIFNYYKYDASLNPVIQHGGKPYELTPVKVVFGDGYYYVTTYSDKYEGFADYRIDRMGQVSISDEPATRNDAIREHQFDENDYQYFGRFDGEVVPISLLVNADKIDIIADRFGDDIEVYPLPESDQCKVYLSVRKSEQFFGWVAGLGGTVTIASPSSLVQEYKDYLQSLIDQIK